MQAVSDVLLGMAAQKMIDCLRPGLDSLVQVVGSWDTANDDLKNFCMDMWELPVWSIDCSMLSQLQGKLDLLVDFSPQNAEWNQLDALDQHTVFTEQVKYSKSRVGKWSFLTEHDFECGRVPI